jgi:RNA polymerase sigma factor (sigma-70 family)
MTRPQVTSVAAVDAPSDPESTLETAFRTPNLITEKEMHRGAAAPTAQSGSRSPGQRCGCHSSRCQSCRDGKPAMTEHQTAELVQRAAEGHELAWRRLFDEFGPRLRHVSASYRLGEAEAADAVATTWLKLVEHIGSLRDGCVVQAWLVTTLRRECLARAHARSRERPVAAFAGVDEPVHIVDFDRWLVRADHRRLVRRALMELTGPQRQLIAMLFTDPALSYAEISDSLAIPIGSIGPTRCRLLEKLRHAMSAQGPEPADAMNTSARSRRVGSALHR